MNIADLHFYLPPTPNHTKSPVKQKQTVPPLLQAIEQGGKTVSCTIMKPWRKVKVDQALLEGVCQALIGVYLGINRLRVWSLD